MRTRVLALSLLGLVTLSATAACGSSSASTSSPAAGGSGGSTSRPTIGVGYFQSATLGSEVLVAGNPELAAKIDGTFKLTPIDSGVAGLAELRGGAFDFVSGVGNPPVVGSIANDTKLKVIFAEYFDAAQLVVPPSITSNAQLAGKTIGALQGSSEDFEIRGWLTTQGLADKAKVVGFPSEAAVAAAYKAHRIDAAYVEIAQALDLKSSTGARQVVTAQQIADLGFPSLNVLAVTDSFASSHHQVVQQVVCQMMKAQELAAGGSADAVITKAAGLIGQTPDQAIPATKVIPWVRASDQLSWLQGPSGTAADGRMAKAYALTAQFLKDQGRVTSTPSADLIASHIDASYAKQAVSDGCGA